MIGADWSAHHQFDVSFCHLPFRNRPLQTVFRQFGERSCRSPPDNGLARQPLVQIVEVSIGALLRLRWIRDGLLCLQGINNRLLLELFIEIPLPLLKGRTFGDRFCELTPEPLRHSIPKDVR